MVHVAPYNQEEENIETEEAQEVNTSIFIVENERTGTSKQGFGKTRKTTTLKKTMATILEEGSTKKANNI